MAAVDINVITMLLLPTLLFAKAKWYVLVCVNAVIVSSTTSFPKMFTFTVKVPEVGKVANEKYKTPSYTPATALASEVLAV